jgi:hypothetical protein
MASIDTLKSSISNHGGIAHPNRFNVIFTPPKMSLLNKNPANLIGNLASGSLSLRNLINDPRDISLLCQSVSIPGRNISTLDYMANKGSRKQPYTFVDSEVAMSFILTSDFYIKTMFDTWMENIFDTENYYVGYKKDYSTDITIQQLNKKNIPVYGVRLVNAYPTTVTDISLDNSTADTVQKMSATFSYDKFIAEDALSSTIGAGMRTLKNLLT